jgi:hypothetical protein
MAERRDGRFARRQAMLREELGDGAIRCELLAQLRDNLFRREQILEFLWTWWREFFDRLADCDWVK